MRLGVCTASYFDMKHSEVLEIGLCCETARLPVQPRDGGHDRVRWPRPVTAASSF